MSTASGYEIDEKAIAIVGMAGRFPGARDLQRFWANLRDGVESVTFFSDAELLAAGVDPTLLANPKYVKAGVVLDGVTEFDAQFFGFSPREAELMDPQHRLLLECAWETLEHAGYTAERYAGMIGVYAGAAWNTYLLNNLSSNRGTLGDDYQVFTANDKDFLPSRISYKLNLRGPSITVQTACSTSLVAVHLACLSLLNYECDMALAGGTTILVPQQTGYLYQEGGIDSPDGHCRAFDADAAGTVFGSGIGLVLLKRLSEAIEDGDTIHAVIKGSAINNDGALKVSYTAPSVDGQAEVIAAAQALANIEPETISYVEAHGTGTGLGDPIEIAALTKAFRASTDRRGFCAVGSLKSNIGHLSVAAGVAGLIKTTLALQHRQIPPSLNLSTPNPQVDWASSPFYVNTALQPWPSAGDPRRAGVSSFGVGGTNAHVILEEAPALVRSDPARPWQVLVLSARSASALATATDNLRSLLRAQPDLNLADVAYTLQVGRAVFRHRQALVCRDVADALAVLEAEDPQRLLRYVDTQEPRDQPVVFMFSGQGAQYVGMGQDLYADEPVFRATVERCCALLRPHLGLDLRTVLYPAPEQVAWATAQLTQTALAQPALFVVAYALAQLWESWGVQPAALIGHSLGEYVAATLAEVFTVEDALQLVAARGALMQAQPGGAMLSVALGETALRARLAGDLDLAAINGPAQCVVSGPVEAVDALDRDLVAQGVSTRRLVTSHAFHGAQLDGVVGLFTEQVRRVRLQAPQRPVVSNVTGTWLTAAEATDPAYWGRQLRATVQWAAGLATIGTVGPRVLLEVGPGQTLTTLARQQPWADGRAPLVLHTLRHPQRSEPDQAVVGRAMVRLWLHGGMLDWPQLHAGTTRRRVPLPTYPFERQRFWIAPRPAAQMVAAVPDMQHKQPELADWFAIPSWRRTPLLAAAPEHSSQQVLLFVDECGVAAGLAERLRAAGHTVSEVRPGAAFAATDTEYYTVRPDQPADYAALMEALRAAERLPTTIVHLWGVTPPDAAPDRAEVVARGFGSLLALAQALGDLDSTPRTLLVVSSQMQQIADEPLLIPEKALLLGPCKVIPQEYPQLTCRSIDLRLPDLADPQHARKAALLQAHLLAEIVTPGGDALVAYRGSERWLPGFEPLRLLPPAPHATQLRERGVYLITGGLGGVGLELAEYLARTVAARLVLLGRRGLPERSAWPAASAAHASDDARSTQMRRIAALEALGAEVLVLSADVADPVQLAAAVAQTLAHFGALHGVIHAAGVAGGGLIQLKTSAAVQEVFAPKLRGTRALEAALAGRALDFMLLCSSTAALTGGLGQVDYCAANAFLDAFAHYHSAATGINTVAVNWDAWQGIGMTVHAAMPRELRERRRGAEPIDHPLIDRCLHRTDDQATYAVELDAANSWLLAEHQIMDTPVLPGTAYIELARAAFVLFAAPSAIEIRDLVFLAPLALPAGTRRMLYTEIERADAGFRFRIRSGAVGESPVGDVGQEHVHGRIRALTSTPPHQEIAALIRASAAIELIEPLDGRASLGALITWGPRWSSLKQLHRGTTAGVALLELPAQFAADLDRVGLHPALLDVATSFMTPFLGAGHYLPLGYDRVTIHGRLPQRLYSAVTRQPRQVAQDDIIVCDIVLVDQEGVELVSIEGFTMRHVADPAAQARALDPAAQLAHDLMPYGETLPPRSAAPASDMLLALADGGMTPAEGSEAFSRILGVRGLPQIIVSTRPIAAVIAEVNALTQARLLAAVDQLRPTQAQHARPHLLTPYVAPRTEAEQELAALWQSLLGVDPVGVNDDFFELGGHSLLATQLITHIRDSMQVELNMRSLFETSTVAGLAAQIEQQRTNSATPVRPTVVALSREAYRVKRGSVSGESGSD